MAENTNSPALAKARLIPLTEDGAESDVSQHITVQFNPASLKVTLSNTLKADSRGGDSETAAQYVDKSSSSLAVDLMFDTSVSSDGVDANSDVRLQTQKIAAAFMKPVEGNDDKLRAPSRCRFQWGAFKFVGMMSSYGETLDFFSPEGIPLRAKLGLALKEDRYQFERDDSVKAKRGELPRFGKSPNNSTQKESGENQTLNETLKNEKKDEAGFRSTALLNGIENVRQLGGQVLQVAKKDPAIADARQMDGSRASPGFNYGKSDTLGSRIPGAFSQVNKTIIRASSALDSAQQQAETAKKRLQSARNRIQDLRDN